MLNEDYKEMLQSLLNNEVKFLVVGAYALGVHGYPRATGDFDLWVEPSPENAGKVYNALSAFGAPISNITERTFAKEGIIFQIGVAPRRIDLITKIDGVIFGEAYPNKEVVRIEDMNVPFLSKKDLIKNKESTHREKDKLDAKYLRKRRPRRESV